MSDEKTTRPIRIAVPSSDGAPTTLPPGAIRASGPLTERPPVVPSTQEEQAAMRTQAILDHTPDFILLSDHPTLVNRVVPPGALASLRDGMIVGSHLGSLTTILERYTPGKDPHKTRVANAANIARLHHNVVIALIIQFPLVMPPDVQARFDSLPEEERHLGGGGPGRYNAYLENGILPSKYIVGIVDQSTGKYQSREDYLATHN